MWQYTVMLAVCVQAEGDAKQIGGSFLATNTTDADKISCSSDLCFVYDPQSGAGTCYDCRQGMICS
jgi:hypothetical protein